MKRLCYLFFAITSVTLTGCGGGADSTKELQAKVDSLTNLVSSQQASITVMHDSIAVLQFPADQRLAKIKQLISEDSFADAKKRNCSFTGIFP